ncbi:Drug exporter of the RND superfamily protein [Candidatus Saccharibacteria bacterium RAAC3_TM7_1]|nr:Drug exporter of the RND superfamily protein [Candidatus Saccharibacteria bacterium RAAC3_TM7_1]
MQKLLKQIGKFSFEHPWRTILAWVVVVALLAIAAATFYKAPGNAMTVPGTEAQTGVETMSKYFPESGKSAGSIVVSVAGDSTVMSYKSQITTLTKDVSEVEGVKRAVNPFENPSAISQDKKAALIQVQLVEESGAIEKSTTDQVQSIVDDARGEGIAIETGGDLVNKFSHQPLGAGEAVGVLVAFLVLIVTFGSLVAAGMPLLIAFTAVGATMAGLFGLSQVIDVNTSTPAIGAMLGIAVGIDYSLFIISRYRSYLSDGMARKKAAIRATMTAGNAVIFAAATVLIALAALSVVGIPFITTMGLTAAAAVAAAAVMAITILPALFRLAGSKIIHKRQRRKADTAQANNATDERKHIWYKWGVLVTKRPLVAIFAALIVIVAIALPAPSLELGMSTDQYAAADTTERKAYDTVTKSFGEGYNAPLMVVVEGLEPVSSAELVAAKTQNQAKAGQISAAQAEEYGKRLHLTKVGNEVAKLNNVETVLPTMINEDGTVGVLQVIPSSGPSDKATTDLINALRDQDNQQKWLKGATFTVTGSTAMLIDINDKLASALPVYLAVVVGLSLLLLVIAFRSILIPIKATLGYLLSVAAMFGALVAVFQWGWFGIAEAPAPIVSFLPLMALGILFGLAMDYQFFLVSSIREAHEHTDDPQKAIINGFSHGSKVVTAAALIMVAVFAGFITNDNSVVQALGFALAVGVFIDAFLVRMTIVPAVMRLMGKKAWWLPAWIGKIIPRIPID